MGERVERGRSGKLRGAAKAAVISLGVLIALYVLLLSTCVSRDEVGRVASPDGRLDAVLVEINAGATADLAYSVQVQPTAWPWSVRSAEAAHLYGAHRSTCAYGVNLRWLTPDRLRIEYLDAAPAKAEKRLEIGNRHIGVELAAGVNDPTAPCGGMDYNLNR